jgi:hypothetical protein
VYSVARASQQQEQASLEHRQRLAANLDQALFEIGTKAYVLE